MCDGDAAPPPPSRSIERVLVVLGLLVLGVLGAAEQASGAMQSVKLGPRLCRTVGGGRIVKLASFPGERIDRRLLPDIRWMQRRYDIFVTDGFSIDPIHAANGEHGIGLAIDIVPDTSRGGTWGEIGELARWAERVQGQPRMPFRWVGWNGDPGHGRGDHLHLSWSHSNTIPGVPARVVYTRICPAADRDTETTGGTTAGTGVATGGTLASPVIAEGD